MGKTTWTAERIEDLKVRALAGQAASTIAAAFGITRNAVLGKTNRLKIRMGATASTSDRSHKPKRLYKRKLYPGWKPMPAQKTLPAAAPRPAQVPSCKPIGLMQLKADSCRYIVDGEGLAAMFCGAASEKDRSYCSLHCSMVYTTRIPMSRAEIELKKREMLRNQAP